MTPKKGAGATPGWETRIVGHGSASPAELIANPRNWREHPRAQREALAAVLDRVGWVQDVIVNRRSGNLIDGHLRVALALERNEAAVPVVYVDLSPEDELLILASLDPIATLATTDSEALRSLLADIALDTGSLRDLLADLAGPPPTVEGLTDPDAVPPLPQHPYVLPGELWELGDHRLLCGDATDAHDVTKLLAPGPAPRLLVTDPPYGVNYDPTWRRDAGINKAVQKMGAVTNDDQVDWTPAWELSPAKVAYVWHGGVHAAAVARNLEAAGMEIRAQIIWVKDRMALSRGAYHWRHEPCWYAVRKGQRADWIGGRKQQTVLEARLGDAGDPTYAELLELWAEWRAASTVWDIAAREDAGHGHGTQKPVECMERPIRNHRGDVYDPFIGSGTTLIAAERAGRRCYAIEIEPQYAQVAIERWQNYSGREAVRL